MHLHLPRIQPSTASHALKAIIEQIAKLPEQTEPIRWNTVLLDAVESMTGWEPDHLGNRCWPRTPREADHIYSTRRSETSGFDGLEIYAIGPRFSWGRYSVEMPLDAKKQTITNDWPWHYADIANERSEAEAAVIMLNDIANGRFFDHVIV